MWKKESLTGEKSIIDIQNGSKLRLWPHILTQFDDFYFGCFLTLRWKIDITFIYPYSVNTLTKSRQTELECAVKVVLLTHFGMIWVHSCQRHMLSIEGYNL